MLPNNYEPARDTCLLYGKFRASVTAAEGFEGVEEMKGKWGYVATQPGSRLVVELDTRVGAGQGKAELPSTYDGQCCLEACSLAMC